MTGAYSARTSSVIGNLELELATRVTDNHSCPRRPSVFEHVGKRLLHNAIAGDRHAERKGRRLALDVKLNGKPGLPHLRDELVKLVKSRLGRMRGRFTSHTQHSQ